MGEKLDSRDRVRRFMLDYLNASALVWEIPGPANTEIQCVQCWTIPTEGTATRESGPSRLVIVECFTGSSGFEVFPQILLGRMDDTAQVVEAMSMMEESRT